MGSYIGGGEVLLRATEREQQCTREEKDESTKTV